MADPLKVNFVQKEALAKALAAKGQEVKKFNFKISLPVVVVIFSTLFFYGVGAMCVKFIWGFQARQIEQIKAKHEAKKKEFEKKDLEYSMAPMLVNIPTEEEGLKQLDIEISFALQSEYARKEFAKKEDLIRDDILFLLSGKNEDELKDLQNRKRIQEEIAHRVNKFLSSKAQIKEVYFPNFLIE